MPKKIARKRAATKPAPKTKKAPKPRQPRDQVLPGMEQVRHSSLDAACASIAECRDTANQARLDEVAQKQAALSYMQHNSVNAYKHAGIELLRVPGHEELRVRLIKDGGDAAVVGGV